MTTGSAASQMGQRCAMRLIEKEVSWTTRLHALLHSLIDPAHGVVGFHCPSSLLFPAIRTLTVWVKPESRSKVGLNPTSAQRRCVEAAMNGGSPCCMGRAPN